MENRYREKLNVVERKAMAVEEASSLVPEQQVDLYLTRISAVFPESCLRGDLTSLRKTLVAEKKR